MDTAEDRVYISPRLKAQEQQAYLDLLKEASAFQNDLWLAQQLRSKHLLNSYEQRRKPKGGYSMVQIPVTAADTLAEGELNRYYIRALCVRAIEDGIEDLEVYRAKQVANPRGESQRLIGQFVNTETLLEDLRSHPGVDTALGLPAGPNSGLSVRIR